jgi:hypothetical protein
MVVVQNAEVVYFESFGKSLDMSVILSAKY